MKQNFFQIIKWKAKNNKNEKGFSLIDTVIALIILLIGALGAATAMTTIYLHSAIASQKTQAKQITQSTIESIFAARDLKTEGAIDNWDKINNNDVDHPLGLFETSIHPIRQSPGPDGIFGTADDACAANQTCPGGLANNPIMPRMTRQIIISDIVENGPVRKKQITVNVRYLSGKFSGQESASTIIANLPFQ